MSANLLKNVINYSAQYVTVICDNTDITLDKKYQRKSINTCPLINFCHISNLHFSEKSSSFKPVKLSWARKFLYGAPKITRVFYKSLLKTFPIIRRQISSNIKKCSQEYAHFSFARCKQATSWSEFPAIYFVIPMIKIADYS